MYKELINENADIFFWSLTLSGYVREAATNSLTFFGCFFCDFLSLELDILIIRIRY